MAVSMIGPKFYAWNRDGKPLAFGKLYTYQARTNVPKATYQSEDQVVENTNPVILNGEGYANVYLSGSYKMVLKDDKDNEIWSSDPVSESNPTEWTNCNVATYLSPTSFEVGGNLTEKFEVGRRVRVDNNTSEYSYSTIESSSFAGGNTVITLIDSVVTTGVKEACVSVVGQDSLSIDDVGFIAEGSTEQRSLSERFGNIVNIMDFGAVGDGVADDTNAIDAAFSRLEEISGNNSDPINGSRGISNRVNAPVLYIPKGTFNYSGTGYNPINNKDINVVGEGVSSSVIRILSDAFFIEANNSSRVMNSIDFKDFKTIGGKGCFLNSKENLTNVGAGVRIYRVHAIGFTDCGIGSISSSQDKWGVQDCIFEAGDSGNRIGLCLPRQVAVVNMSGNIFIGCKYSIKLHNGGHSQYLIGPNNSFFTHAANENVKQADIWAMPNDPLVDPNVGYGLNIFGNRFSNENKGIEAKILIADEDTSVTNVIERPHSTDISTKAFRGMKVTENYFQGTGNPSSSPQENGLIRTFTADCGAIKFKGNEVGQWYPYIVQFASGISDIDQGIWNSCVIEAPKQCNITNIYNSLISNKNIGLVKREPGTFLGSSGEVSPTSNTDPAFKSVGVSQRLDNTLSGGSVTKTRITDAVGGQNGVDVNFGADQILTISTNKSNSEPGRILWFEFDIKRHETLPLLAIQFELELDSGVVYRRTIEAPNQWTRCRLPIMLNDDHSSDSVFQARFRPALFLNSGVNENIYLARAAVYHAKNPVSYEPVQVFDHGWDRGRLILGDYHLWVDSNGDLRINSGNPTSDTDGVIVGTQS